MLIFEPNDDERCWTVTHPQYGEQLGNTSLATGRNDKDGETASFDVRDLYLYLPIETSAADAS